MNLQSCENVILLVAHFIHLLASIHPLSMMSLLHTIHRFFYYWAQPIANDVIAIGLATKVIYYLVNVNIRLSFLFNCPNYTYYLCIVPLLVSDYFSWFVLSVCDKNTLIVFGKPVGNLACRNNLDSSCIGWLLKGILIQGGCLHSQSSLISDGI